MFCPVCGAKVSDDARFCTECGTPLAGLRGDAEARDAPVPADGVPEPARQADPATDSAPQSAWQVDPAANPVSQMNGVVSGVEQDVLSTAGPDFATEAQQPKRSSMMSFLMERRQIGSRLVPTFAIIIASLIAAAGIAYAAIVLYKNVVEPNVQQPTQQGQTVEKGERRAKKREAKQKGQKGESTANEEVTYSSQESSMTVSVPEDPYYSVGERRDWNWSYPQLSANGNQDAADKINEMIKASIQADADVANALPADKGQLPADFEGVCVVRNIDITYMDDSVVCMRDSRYDTMYGSHGVSSAFGIAFDLKTGDVIDAARLFNLSGDGLRNATVSAVTGYLSGKELLGSDFSAEETGERCTQKAHASFVNANVIDGSTPYYVTDQGLVYRTADYELTGVYADGDADVIVAAWKDDSLVGTGANVEYKTFQDLNNAYSE